MTPGGSLRVIGPFGFTAVKPTALRSVKHRRKRRIPKRQIVGVEIGLLRHNVGIVVHDKQSRQLRAGLPNEARRNTNV